MRLLEIGDNGDICLTEDIIQNAPAYAILSHTWGKDDEEVTFKDFKEGFGKSKTGYQKIQFCRDQVIHDRLRHFWVDTCCIDKSNNTELSEAINSMFRWYRNAAKCYVYLSDVSTASHDHVNQSLPEWELAFQKSRWFTRGWTLQELIAPRSVEFFSSNGQRLGDKKLLEQQLYNITGVAIPALRGISLSTFGIDERMLWAEKRQTKREEDKAYSLLGIFDVYMPLIYGEGTENACYRLREEIKKRAKKYKLQEVPGISRPIPSLDHGSSGGHIVLQSDPIFQQEHLQQLRLDTQQIASKEKRYFRLPSSGSPFFTGRESELTKLRTIFTATNSSVPRRVAIWGVGGAGKTQLAFHYALMYEMDFSAVFYVNARDLTTFRKDCFAIARTLKLPEVDGRSVSDHIQDNEVSDLVREWLADREQGDWLLIVDNADSLEEFDPMGYLPATNKGHIILTSRDKQSVGFGHAIELSKMRVEDAQQLFVKRSGCCVLTEAQLEICLEIVTKLGLLPLPVEHAAAYVQSTGMLLLEYLEILERSLESYLMESPPFSLHEETIQTTINMAWKAICKRNTRAGELLAFLAYLDNEGVGESYFLLPSTEDMFRNWKTHKDRGEFLSAMKLLQSFSLVQSARVTDLEAILTMHASVQHCIRALLSLNVKWLLLHRAALFMYTISASKPLDKSFFSHVLDALRTATKLFSQPDRGEPPNGLWLILASLILKYRVFWQVAGLMHELDAISKVIIEALSLEEGPQNRLSIASAMSVRILTVQFTHSSDSFESVVRDYLVDQMVPAAAEFLQNVHISRSDVPVTNFHPCSLVDVLRNQTPPVYLDTILKLLRYAALRYASQSERTILGVVYFRLSQLPKSEPWLTKGRRLMELDSPLAYPVDTEITLDEPVTYALKATRDRSNGNMESTIALLRRLISTNATTGTLGIFHAASHDLAELLHDLNRNTEAATVLQGLTDATKDMTEINIAREYQDFYTWARKAQARTMMSHKHHLELEAMLKLTCETAKKVFGPVSLSSFHAQILLERFYLQTCCHSPSDATRIRSEFTACFVKLYGGRIRIHLGEALCVGKILMTQGAVEIALVVFELFSELAESRIGSDFPLTQRARRWAALARRERAIDIKNKEAGKPSLDFGCMCFPRVLETPEVE